MKTTKQTQINTPLILLGRDKVFQNFLAIDTTHKVIVGTVYKQRDKEGNIAESRPPLFVVVPVAAVNAVNKAVNEARNLGFGLIKPKMLDKVCLLVCEDELFMPKDVNSMSFVWTPESFDWFQRPDVPGDPIRIETNVSSVFETDRMLQNLLLFKNEEDSFEYALSIQGKYSKRIIFPNFGGKAKRSLSLYEDDSRVWSRIRAVWPELNLSNGFADNSAYISMDSKIGMPNARYIQIDKSTSATLADGSENTDVNNLRLRTFGI